MADNIGKVIQISGPAVDVQFEEEIGRAHV